MKCWKCKAEIGDLDVFRTSECPVCHCDLHCCKGCRFYSASSHFECKENIMEPVHEKEKANFCDFFSCNKVGGEEADNSLMKNAAFSAASALFGEEIKTTGNDSDKAKNAFNSLFGDL
ncbi:MAG: hypothetical protein MJ188_04080 [Treponema sp.]|nr:hypothetical protein [Treponema sp.]